MKHYKILDKYGNMVFVGDTRDCARYFKETVSKFNNAAWYARKYGTLHKEYQIEETEIRSINV